jgi:hypothetical protein
MDNLYNERGHRVCCGQVLRIKAEGKWWGRYEMDGQGLGYFVDADDKCYDLDAVAEIDWSAST